MTESAIRTVHVSLFAENIFYVCLSDFLEQKNKRKRKSTMYDDDEDYDVVDRELPNPFIVSGPCGSGKTSAVGFFAFL